VYTGGQVIGLLNRDKLCRDTTITDSSTCNSTDDRKWNDRLKVCISPTTVSCSDAIRPSKNFGGIIGSFEKCKSTGTYNEGHLFQASSHTFIEGSSYLGGLVGFLEDDCAISDSYSAANIMATHVSNPKAGGLVGAINAAGVMNRVFFAGGSITTTNISLSYGDIGARAGSESISNCLIGSQYKLAPGCTQKTHPQIRTASIFNGAGFDIDDVLDSDKIWYSPDDTKDYPRLKFEKKRPCEGLHGETPFAMGDGSAEDPYGICNDVHLLNIIVKDNSNAHFKLLGDIDLYSGHGSGAVVSQLEVSGGLKGVLEGFYYSINNLSKNINSTSGANEIAFLNEIASTGVVRNLNFYNIMVKNAETTGNPPEHYAGVVAINNGLIENVSAYGYVNGGHYTSSETEKVGGISAINRGQIVRSKFHGRVYGFNNVGGLVGVNDGGLILNSAVNGLMASTKDDGQVFGGLVGLNQSSDNEIIFKDSFWGRDITYYGDIIESSSSMYIHFGNFIGHHIGGLVGINRGYIGDSETHSTLSTNRYVSESLATGAFCDVDDDLGTLRKCPYIYNIGGFVGVNEGEIRRSISRADFKFNWINAISTDFQGPFVGKNDDNLGGVLGHVDLNADGNIDPSEYDVINLTDFMAVFFDATPIVSPIDGTQTINFYDDRGFDIVDDSSDEIDRTWRLPADGGPVLGRRGNFATDQDFGGGTVGIGTSWPY